MPSVLALSAKGASFLILIQICSKSLTFIINQLLLRHLSPETLGVSTQLELFAITVLYFSRESFRVVLQRPTSSIQVAINVAYIPLMLGLPISISLGLFYTRSESLSSLPSIRLAFALSGLSALIKLAYEPCFAVVQQRLLYNIRARAEASAAITRCIVTYLTVVYFKNNYGDVGGLPFAVGLVAGAIVLFTTYYILMIPIAREGKFSLLPKKIQIGSGMPASEFIASYFSRSLCSLGLNIYLQSSVKYILTQGDALLITSLATLHDQGAYALASNYGGLIARVVFQPIEESSRNLFAKLCLPPETSFSTKPNSSPDQSSIKSSSKPTNGVSKNKSTSDDISDNTSNTSTTNPAQAAQILTNFLHLYSLLSLVSVSIGPPLAPLLLHVLAGQRWTATNAPRVLSTYTYYIPFLAINGVTEAFVAAVATNADLRTQSIFLFANFLGFALTAWACVTKAGMGAEGLIWACCVGLGGRCVWNSKFIHKFFADRGVHLRLGDMLPTFPSVAFAIAAIAVVRSDKVAPGILADGLLDRLLGVGGLGACLGIAILVFERAFLWNCYRMIVPKSASA